MPYKNIEDSRAAIRKHYYANRERYIEKNRLRRQAIKEYINTLKSSTACADCKEYYPYYVMDFDHLEDKASMISQLVKRNNLSALNIELKKCEIVCSNCHRIRTFNRIKPR